MKANDILNTALTLAVLLTIVLALKFLFFPSPVPVNVADTLIQRDTTTVHDTLFIPQSINISKLKAKLSREIKDSLMIYFNQHPGKDSSDLLIAYADTTIQKDSNSIKVSYYFPPYNYFDIALNIKQKIIKEFQTITELKTVTVDLPFYKQITFWTTIASIFLLFLVK